MSLGNLHDIRSCILGHAVADALGVPVEFQDREELERYPVTDMRGYGTYAVPAGSWSDDTSMTLCALEALGGEAFSWDTVMENFCSWLYDGKFTPTGETFDAGRTCVFAIGHYRHDHADAEHCGLTGKYSCGNGSLMRIIPFALCKLHDMEFIETASALTHAHRRCQMACGIYAMLLHEILTVKEKSTYRAGLKKAASRYAREQEWEHFAPLSEIESRTRDSIRSSGYVVDTLEAALWCFATTDSYRDCVLKAVNLGGDTDTVAAVAGGLAGALYGVESIPQGWLDTLLQREYIERLCMNAANRWKA